jgi:lipopolysaccharide assembly outer membrane protein LptD (OstA)
VDSGVTFERDTNFAGTDYIQTLEPRVYYLYVPTATSPSSPTSTRATTTSTSRRSSPKTYTGGDRISNANQVTTALQTRLIDPASGAEKIRAAIGQRYYMVDQRVSLNQNSPVRTGKQADLLAAFSATFAPKTTLDTAWQYNPRDNWTERFNFGVRFQPAYAKALGSAGATAATTPPWPARPTASATSTSPASGRCGATGTASAATIATCAITASPRASPASSTTAAAGCSAAWCST